MISEIAIYANHIPPEYSGSGYRALEHGKWLKSKNELAFIFTETFYFTKSKVNIIPLEKLNYLESILYKFRPFRFLIFCKRVLKVVNSNCEKFSILHSFYGNGFAAIFVYLSRKYAYKSIIEVTVSSKRYSGFEKINPFQLLRNWTWRNCDALIAISPKIYKEFEDRGVNTEKCYLIPNGVDISRFKKSAIARSSIRNRFELTDEDTMLLSIGEVCDRKGSDITYSIFKKLVSKGKKVKLFFIGSYDGEYFNYDKSDFNEYVDRGQIIFPGIVNNPEDYLNACDIFLFPSRQEGLGNAPLEAMACETIVISNLIPDITDYYIKCGETGFLIKNNNLEDYINIIEKLMLDSKHKKVIEKRAYNWILSNMTTSSIYSKYSDLYTKLSLNGNS